MKTDVVGRSWEKGSKARSSLSTSGAILRLFDLKIQTIAHCSQWLSQAQPTWAFLLQRHQCQVLDTHWVGGQSLHPHCSTPDRVRSVTSSFTPKAAGVQEVACNLKPLLARCDWSQEQPQPRWYLELQCPVLQICLPHQTQPWPRH